MSERYHSDFGPITLDALIKELENRQFDDDGKPRAVCFDFGCLKPCPVDSYRGYYDHLAMGWETWEDIRKRDPYCDGMTVTDIVENLKSAVGKSFVGYKGGEFTMSDDTPVWVDNHGEATGTGIVGVRSDGWLVVLLTDRFS